MKKEGIPDMMYQPKDDISLEEMELYFSCEKVQSGPTMTLKEEKEFTLPKQSFAEVDILKEAVLNAKIVSKEAPQKEFEIIPKEDASTKNDISCVKQEIDLTESETKNVLKEEIIHGMEEDLQNYGEITKAMISKKELSKHKRIRQNTDIEPKKGILTGV